MAILASQLPGIALLAEVDPTSPQYEAELTELRRAIEAARTQGKFQDFLAAKKPVGKKLQIAIIPCRLEEAGASGKPDALDALTSELRAAAVPTGQHEVPDWAAALQAAAAKKKSSLG